MISVIIPTYNRPNYLGAQLAFIDMIKARNGVPRLETIIVNDGSSLENNELYRKYISDFEKKIDLTYIELPKNSNTVSIPRNIGISWATGDVIAPVDDDCFLLESKFTNLYNLLLSNTINIMAYGNRDVYHKNYDGDHIYEKTYGSEIFTKDKKRLGLDNGQMIYKRSVYDNIPPIFAINACDWYTYQAFSDLGEFVYLNESVCQYTWHGSNISLLPKHQRQEPIPILHNFIEYFKEGKIKDDCESLINT